METGGTEVAEAPPAPATSAAPPPPPSPLSGGYLLIIIGEPHSEEHKQLILQKLAKGFLSWNAEVCHVDLEKELRNISTQAPEGEESRNGERLIQFASESLVTEVLIQPQTSTLMQCARNLLSSFTRHRHIIHAGYAFAGNGSWALQDGTFSCADFLDALQEPEAQRVIRAYENSVSIDIYCSTEGDWSTQKLNKEQCTRGCQLRVNPDDTLSAGSPDITAFVEYISTFVNAASVEQLLEPSDVVGNIRFSHPTLYVFPGGQGDAALFGINGFNMLVDGGYARKSCFWDFTRHLDRLDAVMVTRLNNSNINGIASVLKRKRLGHVYPQIGHFFCNMVERKNILSPDGDKDKDSLIVDLLEEGHELVTNLRHLELKPHACYRDSVVEPINLYHKVGHGKLDMYVISPGKDSKDVKEFLSKWNNSDQKLFSSKTNKNEMKFPLPNLMSICALLVWQPANPTDTITRILFPGSTPQHKIFEGLEKLKHLEFLKHPVCTAKTIQPAAPKIKSKIIEKISPDNKAPTKSISSLQEAKLANAESKVSKIQEKSPKRTQASPVIISSKIEKSAKAAKPEAKIEKEERTTLRSEKTKTENKAKTEKSKAETRAVQTKAKSDSKTATRGAIDRKLQRTPSNEKKTEKVSPPTPKKSDPKPKTDSKGTNQTKSKTKSSPTATPAKSAKEANNRKVVESKIQATKVNTVRSAKAKVSENTSPASKVTDKKGPLKKSRTGSPSKSMRPPGSPTKATSLKSGGVKAPKEIVKPAEILLPELADVTTVSEIKIASPTEIVKPEVDEIIEKTIESDTIETASTVNNDVTEESAVLVVASDNIENDSDTCKVPEKESQNEDEEGKLDVEDSEDKKEDESENPEKEENLDTTQAELEKEETKDSLAEEIKDDDAKESASYIDSQVEEETEDDVELDKKLLETDDRVSDIEMETKDIELEDDIVSDEAEDKHIRDEEESEKERKVKDVEEEKEKLDIDAADLQASDADEQENAEESDLEKLNDSNKEMEEKEQTEKHIDPMVDSTDLQQASELSVQENQLQAKQPQEVVEHEYKEELIVEGKFDYNEPSTSDNRKIKTEIVDLSSPISEDAKQKLETEVKDIISSAQTAVANQIDSINVHESDLKNESLESEEKMDLSSEKNKEEISPEDDKKDQKLGEDGTNTKSQPDEKVSAMETSATTAPSMPEDERIPLDEIEEIVEEKYTKEDTKEKDTDKEEKITKPPIIPNLPEVITSVPFDQTAHVLAQRDIVKTPDEVADLPVHEEVDAALYDSFDVGKSDVKKDEGGRAKENQNEEENKNIGEEIKEVESSILKENAILSEKDDGLMENQDQKPTCIELADTNISGETKIVEEIKKDAIPEAEPCKTNETDNDINEIENEENNVPLDLKQADTNEESLIKDAEIIEGDSKSDMKVSDEAKESVILDESNIKSLVINKTDDSAGHTLETDINETNQVSDVLTDTEKDTIISLKDKEIDSQEIQVKEIAHEKAIEDVQTIVKLENIEVSTDVEQPENNIEVLQEANEEENDKNVQSDKYDKSDEEMILKSVDEKNNIVENKLNEAEVSHDVVTEQLEILEEKSDIQETSSVVEESVIKENNDGGKITECDVLLNENERDETCQNEELQKSLTQEESPPIIETKAIEPDSSKKADISVSKTENNVVETEKSDTDEHKEEKDEREVQQQDTITTETSALVESENIEHDNSKDIADKIEMDLALTNEVKTDEHEDEQEILQIDTKDTNLTPLSSTEKIVTDIGDELDHSVDILKTSPIKSENILSDETKKENETLPKDATAAEASPLSETKDAENKGLDEAIELARKPEIESDITDTKAHTEKQERLQEENIQTETPSLSEAKILNTDHLKAETDAANEVETSQIDDNKIEEKEKKEEALNVDAQFSEKSPSIETVKIVPENLKESNISADTLDVNQIQGSKIEAIEHEDEQEDKIADAKPIIMSPLSESIEIETKNIEEAVELVNKEETYATGSTDTTDSKEEKDSLTIDTKSAEILPLVKAEEIEPVKIKEEKVTADKQEVNEIQINERDIVGEEEKKVGEDSKTATNTNEVSIETVEELQKVDDDTKNQAISEDKENLNEKNDLQCKDIKDNEPDVKIDSENIILISDSAAETTNVVVKEKEPVLDNLPLETNGEISKPVASSNSDDKENSSDMEKGIDLGIEVEDSIEKQQIVKEDGEENISSTLDAEHSELGSTSIMTYDSKENGEEIEIVEKENIETPEVENKQKNTKSDTDSSQDVEPLKTEENVEIIKSLSDEKVETESKAAAVETPETKTADFEVDTKISETELDSMKDLKDNDEEVKASSTSSEIDEKKIDITIKTDEPIEIVEESELITKEVSSSAVVNEAEAATTILSKEHQEETNKNLVDECITDKEIPSSSTAIINEKTEQIPDNSVTDPIIAEIENNITTAETILHKVSLNEKTTKNENVLNSEEKLENAADEIIKVESPEHEAEKNVEVCTKENGVIDVGKSPLGSDETKQISSESISTHAGESELASKGLECTLDEQTLSQDKNTVNEIEEDIVCSGTDAKKIICISSTENIVNKTKDEQAESVEDLVSATAKETTDQESSVSKDEVNRQAATEESTKIENVDKVDTIDIVKDHKGIMSSKSKEEQLDTLSEDLLNGSKSETQQINIEKTEDKIEAQIVKVEAQQDKIELHEDEIETHQDEINDGEHEELNKTNEYMSKEMDNSTEIAVDSDIQQESIAEHSMLNEVKKEDPEKEISTDNVENTTINTESDGKSHISTTTKDDDEQQCTDDQILIEKAIESQVVVNDDCSAEIKDNKINLQEEDVEEEKIISTPEHERSEKQQLIAENINLSDKTVLEGEKNLDKMPETHIEVIEDKSMQSTKTDENDDNTILSKSSTEMQSTDLKQSEDYESAIATESVTLDLRDKLEAVKPEVEMDIKSTASLKSSKVIDSTISTASCKTESDGNDPVTLVNQNNLESSKSSDSINISAQTEEVNETELPNLSEIKVINLEADGGLPITENLDNNIAKESSCKKNEPYDHAENGMENTENNVSEDLHLSTAKETETFEEIVAMKQSNEAETTLTTLSDAVIKEANTESKSEANVIEFEKNLVVDILEKDSADQIISSTTLGSSSKKIEETCDNTNKSTDSEVKFETSSEETFKSSTNISNEAIISSNEIIKDNSKIKSQNESNGNEGKDSSSSSESKDYKDIANEKVKENIVDSQAISNIQIMPALNENDTMTSVSSVINQNTDKIVEKVVFKELSELENLHKSPLLDQAKSQEDNVNVKNIESKIQNIENKEKISNKSNENKDSIPSNIKKIDSNDESNVESADLKELPIAISSAKELSKGDSYQDESDAIPILSKDKDNVNNSLPNDSDDASMEKIVSVSDPLTASYLEIIEQLQDTSGSDLDDEKQKVIEIHSNVVAASSSSAEISKCVPVSIPLTNEPISEITLKNESDVIDHSESASAPETIKIQETNDVSSHHRVMLTASSEDGGDETELATSIKYEGQKSILLTDQDIATKISDTDLSLSNQIPALPASNEPEVNDSIISSNIMKDSIDNLKDDKKISNAIQEIGSDLSAIVSSTAETNTSVSIDTVLDVKASDLKDQPEENTIHITTSQTIPRGTTPTSDSEHDVGPSTPHSDISSGQMSRAPHLWDDQRPDSRHSDLSDKEPISPQSTASQQNFSFDKPHLKEHDAMTSSFYGSLPDEDNNAQQSSHHVHTVSQGVRTETPEIFKHEDSYREEDEELDLPQVDQHNKKEALKTCKETVTDSNFSADFGNGNAIPDIPQVAQDVLNSNQPLPSTSETKQTISPNQDSASKKSESANFVDPIASWGKPLGLPSPAPPPPTNSNDTQSSGRGTPKKEKKVAATRKNIDKIKEGKINKENSSKQKSLSHPMYFDLTYVPHHGNSHYTQAEFFKKIRARYYVFSGTEPSRDVYSALLEGKETWDDKDLEVTIIPTYDTDTLGYWVAENEEALQQNKIDLSPSASRCTINLQDHETSCSAYRLEF